MCEVRQCGLVVSEGVTALIAIVKTNGIVVGIYWDRALPLIVNILGQSLLLFL